MEDRCPICDRLVASSKEAATKNYAIKCFEGDPWCELLRKDWRAHSFVIEYRFNMLMNAVEAYLKLGSTDGSIEQQTLRTQLKRFIEFYK